MVTAGQFTAFIGETYETYPGGTEIFREGDPGDRLYVVRSGIVDLVKGEMFLESVEAGGAFGEMALLSDGVRTATAIAREEATVCAVDEARFDRVLQNNPFLARRFMRLIVDRLAVMNERLKGYE